MVPVWPLEKSQPSFFFFYEKGIIFRMYPHFWMVKLTHHFLILCKNSKEIQSSFAYVHFFTFCGTQFQNFLCYGVLFSQRKKWAGQKQHTFHSVGSPLLPSPISGVSLLGPESESWWLPDGIWICCCVFSHSFLLVQDFPLFVSLPSDSCRYW